MRTILHAITTLAGGGAERQLSMLALEQARRGFEVHVAVRQDGVYGPVLRAHDIPIHHLGDLRGPHPLMVARLARLVRRIRPAVLQTWLAQMDVVGGLVAAVTRVPWVLAERSTGEGHAVTPITAAVRHRIGRRATAIVANSSGGAAYWRTGLRTVTTIANAVDLAGIAAAPAVSLATGSPVVLFVGRLVDDKAPEVFVRAVARAPRVHAVMLGDGPLHASLAREIELLGIRERITTVPFRPDWWGLLKTANAAVSTSRFEGHPNVVLEAMAARCPLILSDIPAHREIVDDRGAVFVPPEDASAVALAIETVLSDVAGTQRRIEAAFAGVANLTISATAEAYEQVYQSLDRPR